MYDATRRDWKKDPGRSLTREQQHQRYLQVLMWSRAGLTYREIGERLGCSRSNVQVLRRAGERLMERKRVRAHISRREHFKERWDALNRP